MRSRWGSWGGRLVGLALVLALAVGCGGSDGDGEGRADARGAPLPDTCEDACTATTLVADFGRAQRTFDRAVYGVTEDAIDSFHLEAYVGGEPGCPSETSAAADVTFILGTLPIPSDTSSFATTAGLVDLEGALLPDVPSASSSSATVTPVALADDVVALDVSATFSGGTVVGHIYATHCDSLDQ